MSVSRPFSSTGGQIAGGAWVAMSLVCLWTALAGVGPALWIDEVQSSVFGWDWPMLTWIVLVLGAFPLACLLGLLYDWATRQGLFDPQNSSTADR
jgi:hypothetical protein